MAEREPERHEEVGYRGGAYVGAVRAPGAAEILLPLERIQWGPVFAGFVIANAITLFLAALGVAAGLDLAQETAGLGYWLVGSAIIGIFLGSLVTVWTSGVGKTWPAILHSTVVWALLVVVSLISGGVPAVTNIGALNQTALNQIATAGWWVFIGYLILWIAAILGGLTGMAPASKRAERAS